MEVKEESKPVSTEELFSADTPSPKEEVSSPKTKTKEETEPKTEVKEEKTPSPENGKEQSENTPPSTEDWKVKFEETEKRLKETRDWATKVNGDNTQVMRQMEELRKQNEILQQKYDGTYDEDAAKAAQKQIDDYQREYNAKFETSKALAIKEFGEEEVNKRLFMPDSPFQKLNTDPVNITRVQMSPTPVYEALRIVEENEFFGKYGRDLSKIPDKIREEIEPKIREEVTKEFREKIKQKKQQSESLGDVNSTKTDTKTPVRSATTKELFG